MGQADVEPCHSSAARRGFPVACNRLKSALEETMLAKLVAIAIVAVVLLIGGHELIGLIGELLK